MNTGAQDVRPESIGYRGRQALDQADALRPPRHAEGDVGVDDDLHVQRTGRLAEALELDPGRAVVHERGRGAVHQGDPVLVRAAAEVRRRPTTPIVNGGFSASATSRS